MRQLLLAKRRKQPIPEDSKDPTLTDIEHSLNMANALDAVPADDLDAMAEIFGSDFPELASLFQADSQKRIAALYQAAAQGDYAEMIRLAHVFSGSASSMGASYLAFLCKTFEAQIQSGLFTDLEPRLQAIEAEYARTDNRLQLLLKAV
jgi:HPt (histidine-containing phosphotransfer) domain-containing protein